MMGLLKKIALLIVVLPLLSSCIREEEVTNTPQGNFEALWKIIDEQYCFLEKGTLTSKIKEETKIISLKAYRD